jgi:hypothetical protein
VYDTLALSRRCRPDLPSHRLERLATIYDLDTVNRHRALADCLRVKLLWLALRGPATPKEMLVSYPIHNPDETAPAPHGWDTLEQAIALGWTVRIEYDGGTRGASPRSITPRRFLQRGGVSYIVAYCHLDAIEKSFRLDRIRSCDGSADPQTSHRHVDRGAASR